MKPKKIERKIFDLETRIEWIEEQLQEQEIHQGASRTVFRKIAGVTLIVLGVLALSACTAYYITLMF